MTNPSRKQNDCFLPVAEKNLSGAIGREKDVVQLLYSGSSSWMKSYHVTKNRIRQVTTWAFCEPTQQSTPGVVVCL